ncbi:hypothetical protein ACWKSP_40835 [Micromonosporaceae bacterium Da 78-11]
MTTPAPLTVPPPSVPTLVEVLATLGRPALVSAGSPPAQATLHLTRMLVAVAERHAVSAELACGPGGRDGHDVDTYQGTYDTATVRATFERLALAHWRSQRLVATVTALRKALVGDGPDPDDPDADVEQEEDASALMWELAEHTTIAADAVIEVIARLITPPAETTTAGVERLDAATALLVSAGQRAAELRAAIGLDAE